jgi:uroporphyrinogen-III synthase
MSDRRGPIVVVTRDERVDDGFSRALAALGAQPVPLQTIRVEPVQDLALLDAALDRLDSFEWVIFTSANAVDATCVRAAWRTAWVRPIRPRVAAVGPSTKAHLDARGVAVAVTPPRASALDLVAALQSDGHVLKGARMLWPRSEIAPRDLADALESAGALVSDPVVYRTVAVTPPGLTTFVRDLESGTVDAVAFLSPSSARALAQQMPDGTLASIAGRAIVASIGPSTSDALRTLGAAPEIEPAERSATALAEAICAGVIARRGVRA